MANSKLVKVSTYASWMGLSTMAIYKQIERGALKYEKIDGVTFVIVDESIYETIRNEKK